MWWNNDEYLSEIINVYSCFNLALNSLFDFKMFKYHYFKSVYVNKTWNNELYYYIKIIHLCNKL